MPAVGNVFERLDGNDAAIAVRASAANTARSDPRPRPGRAGCIVHLDVARSAGRQPAIDEPATGTSSVCARRPRVDHGAQAGFPIASTISAASATVLMSGVSPRPSGSMQ